MRAPPPKNSSVASFVTRSGKRSFTFGREIPRPALASTYGEIWVKVKSRNRASPLMNLVVPPRVALTLVVSERVTSVGQWKRSALIRISRRSFGEKPIETDWLSPPALMSVPTAPWTLTRVPVPWLAATEGATNDSTETANSTRAFMDELCPIGPRQRALGGAFGLTYLNGHGRSW